jgi:hypothetical protein
MNHVEQDIDIRKPSAIDEMLLGLEVTTAASRMDGLARL